MREAIYVIAAAMVLSVVVTWTLGSSVDRIRDPLVVTNAIALRFGVGLIFAISAAEAAMDGGYAWIVVPLLGFLAVWSFVVGVGMIWVWEREGLGESHAP